MPSEQQISSEEIPREYIRIPVNKPVKASDEEQQIVTPLQDVSLGGVKLIWPSVKNVNDLLTVYFSTDLYFDGNVRWCQSTESHYELGVQFLDLDEIAALYLAEYIENLQEDNSRLLAEADF